MGILRDEIEGDVGSVPQCATCGSERVVRRALACWSAEFGLWQLQTVQEQAFCQQCEQDTTLTWKRQELPPNKRIRELNDVFRTQGQGRGSIMLTLGIQEKGGEVASTALHAVRTFDAFSDENDPWGEHDFGAIEIEGQKVFFKIDYYDPSLENGSEDPANEGVTHRVMTIMLASEY